MAKTICVWPIRGRFTSHKCWNIGWFFPGSIPSRFSAKCRSSSGRKEFFPVLAAAIVGVYDRAFFLELRARS